MLGSAFVSKFGVHIVHCKSKEKALELILFSLHGRRKKGRGRGRGRGEGEWEKGRERLL